MLPMLEDQYSFLLSPLPYSNTLSLSSNHRGLDSPTQDARPLVQKWKKQVRFADVPVVYEHLHHRDMTRRERALAWYYDRQYETMQQTIKYTRVLMGYSCGTQLLGEDFCSRGVESSVEQRETNAQIQRCRESVMAIQRLLVLRKSRVEKANPATSSCCGLYDDGEEERIATICRFFSSPARKLAHERGLQDANESLQDRPVDSESIPVTMTSRWQC